MANKEVLMYNGEEITIKLYGAGKKSFAGVTASGKVVNGKTSDITKVEPKAESASEDISDEDYKQPKKRKKAED